jgi:hypothetical protein
MFPELLTFVIFKVATATKALGLSETMTVTCKGIKAKLTSSDHSEKNTTSLVGKPLAKHE